MDLYTAKRESDNLVFALAGQDPAIVGMVDAVWNVWFDPNMRHLELGQIKGYRGKAALRTKPAARMVPGITRPRLRRTDQHLYADTPRRARVSTSGIKKDRKGKRRSSPPPEDAVFISISEDEDDGGRTSLPSQVLGLWTGT